MLTYYTPHCWGRTLVEGIVGTSPKGIIDPAVGDGSLLVCGAKDFPESSLFGTDVDPIAVAKSKSVLPKAVISNANALNVSSLSRSAVWRRRSEIDTVIMNPPFAGDRKIHSIYMGGQKIVCSIAAAHLLASVEHYAPDMLAAIMPCSFFHSDRDLQAVDTICRAYDMTRAGGVHRSAFSRGRASSELVYFRRRDSGCTSDKISGECGVPDRPMSGDMQVCLVRGGMPVHAAKRSLSTSGLPFIHTKGLVHSSGFLFLVSPIQRGIISGVAVLLPRVGTPNRQHLRVREYSSPRSIVRLCTGSVLPVDGACFRCL